MSINIEFSSGGCARYGSIQVLDGLAICQKNIDRRGGGDLGDVALEEGGFYVTLPFQSQQQNQIDLIFTSVTKLAPRTLCVIRCAVRSHVVPCVVQDKRRPVITMMAAPQRLTRTYRLLLPSQQIHQIQ